MQMRLPATVLTMTVALVVMTAGTAQSLPHNARQVAEGYWVGGMPTVDDIASLREQGIRLIVSSTRLDGETRLAVRRYGIEHLNVRWGRHFPDVTEILEGTAAYQPGEIYLHCTHGGDRAGALLAFMLVAREGWRPDHAILAVAFPGENDVRRIIEVLEDAGLIVTDEERERYVGIYSGARNGGTGGLKMRSEDYRTLIETTLGAMAEAGAMLEESPVVESEGTGLTVPTE
jgi:protein tyrosine phosphatase (PTP) superfamily phosphohydrolase (DUF442 family)